MAAAAPKWASGALSLNGDSLRILRLCALGQISDALAAAHVLISPPPHPKAFAALFRACARGGLLAEGAALHYHLLSSSHLPDLFLSNHILNMYTKCGRLDLAHRLFDEMPSRNRISWTTLLTGYGQHGRHNECFRLFSAMLSHHLPNEFALAGVLASCATPTRALCGRQVHAFALKTSFDTNVYVANSLITMYSSCHSVDDAWAIFETMTHHRNLISWNSMITGFLLNGKRDLSLGLFVQMHCDGIGFDRANLVGAVSSCSSLYECRELHSLVIKSSFESEVEVATALMKAYFVLGGGVDEYYRVFKGVREHDIVSWTGFMTMHAENDPEVVILLFRQLRREGFEPDRYMFSTLIKASAGLATERCCSALHSLVLKSGFGADTVLSNALIHAYARCGNIRLAEHAFEQMEIRDEVSWNSMIKAYAAHGQGREALGVFSRMNISPDSATFVGLLTACSHGGLVDEGHDIFQAMTECYGISPQLDHYACMVDILGRAGKLLEAEDLVNQMPMEPDAVIWSALLGACRKHGEVNIGEKAAQKLTERDPQNSLGYVMMSNIYGAMGSFGDAAFVRKEMKVCRVKKEPGLSWIEIGNHVHKFSAGGRHHPQREAIYTELKRLADKLRKMGYVADTRLVLHEIAEEHKEERLLFHSERLALAFGLMNTSGSQASVKIMKNIRICEDCHNFMKFTSKCVEKDIVVRDSNRFHHFVDGVCSCNDYW